MDIEQGLFPALFAWTGTAYLLAGQRLPHSFIFTLSFLEVLFGYI